MSPWTPERLLRSTKIDKPLIFSYYFQSNTIRVVLRCTFKGLTQVAILRMRKHVLRTHPFGCFRDHSRVDLRFVWCFRPNIESSRRFTWLECQGSQSKMRLSLEKLRPHSLSAMHSSSHCCGCTVVFNADGRVKDGPVQRNKTSWLYLGGLLYGIMFALSAAKSIRRIESKDVLKRWKDISMAMRQTENLKASLFTIPRLLALVLNASSLPFHHDAFLITSFSLLA